ncbi:flagellar biosynthetic protein FliO [Sphingomonas sp. HMP6]|uniref:flagellar biosynthetic protein FliO n=1 Tax=Sphingomonas sp. HMP6 TaxID=1517551 RepID=UPI001596571F|nr:flagellar biosynthetic protein FliO [Sphingomonas sp. HMP6]BCA58935.1 hypothetical protein HMP06_1704 [Sphingomonas sp. HMP6]
MDLASIVRTLGGLATVLGIMSAALWMVRRYDIRLPGRTGMLRVSRLELVERLPLDARRSVALLRRDGREHLILIAPEGHLILESAVVRDAADVAATAAIADALPRAVPQFRAELAAAGQSFGTLVDHARKRASPFGGELGRMVARFVAGIASARARAKDLPIPPPIALRPIAGRILRDARQQGARLGGACAAVWARSKRVDPLAVNPLETFVAMGKCCVRRAASFDALRIDVGRSLARRSTPLSLSARRALMQVGAAARAAYGTVHNARRLLARQQRHVSAQVQATIRRVTGPNAAFAVAAPPIFHDPPVPLRSSTSRKPSRKAARKAHAARRGVRHA